MVKLIFIFSETFPQLEAKHHKQEWFEAVHFSVCISLSFSLRFLRSSTRTQRSRTQTLVTATQKGPHLIN